MRRLLMFFVVITLAFGLTQCRKNYKEIIPYNKKAFNITLNVDGGAKINVIPETGAVLFEEGDEIIVANNGVYVGRLICDGEAFIGTITNPDPCDYLHFYHLGNRDVTLTEGSSTDCFVSIADQTLSLPVISYGRSYDKFSPDYLAYTTRLQNKCALVKFDVSTRSRYAGTYIKDLNNVVHVDFAQSSFDYFKEWEGNITLPPGSGEKWAILLPQPEKEEGGLGSVFSGAYAGMRGVIPEIKENIHYPEGIPVNVEIKTVPKGALEGLFTVDKKGKQVHFAKGNLVYDKITKMWRFFENQFEMLYTVETNVGDDYSETNMIEHFGWATSGFNHGGITYQPWITGEPNTNYYAYGDERKGLYAETGIADWGCNLIDNGGMAYRQWRTITAKEMTFLLEDRKHADEKYSFGSIKDGEKTYNGLIILPDDWILPDGLRFIPAVVDDFKLNSYKLSDWALMEAAGAVFLPCSGRRHNGLCTCIQTNGYYWTSDAFDVNQSNCLAFERGRLTPACGYIRFNGMPVRLLIE